MEKSAKKKLNVQSVYTGTYLPQNGIRVMGPDERKRASRERPLRQNNNNKILILFYPSRKICYVVFIILSGHCAQRVFMRWYRKMRVHNNKNNDL